jgi:hypothetical protein
MAGAPYRDRERGAPIIGAFMSCAQLTVPLALLLVLAAAPVAGGEPTARDFLQSIYAQYVGKDSKGVRLDDSRAIKRWFAPPLATLIVRDRARADKRQEVPNLDGDPFIDGQDWELSDLDIAVTESGARATGKVSFVNGRKVALTFALIKVAGQWRISDIVGGTYGSLVTFMKKWTNSK